MYETGAAAYEGYALSRQDIDEMAKSRRDGYRDAVGYLRSISLRRLLTSHPVDVLTDEIEATQAYEYFPESYWRGWNDLVFELETQEEE